MRTAHEIYISNVRETHAHFDSKEEAVRLSWLNSNMEIDELDRRISAIRRECAFYLNQEVKLYHLNQKGERG
jgi:hypothetical protein